MFKCSGSFWADEENSAFKDCLESIKESEKVGTVASHAVSMILLLNR
jgi:hypothetical protein